jgi:hypothetical protein
LTGGTPDKPELKILQRPAGALGSAQFQSGTFKSLRRQQSPAQQQRNGQLKTRVAAPRNQSGNTPVER